MKAVGWTAATIVLLGILTAWMDPSSGGLMHGGALMLAAAYALCALIRRSEVPVHWVALLPLGCAVLGLVQLTTHWTVYRFETWNSVTAWLARAAIFSVAYAGFVDDQRRDRLKRIVVWFGGAFSLLALLQWYTSGGSILWIVETQYKSEVAGTFGNRDQYAALIELMLPVALAACIGFTRLPLLPAACAGLMFASVIASGSRAGTFVVCIEALAFIAVACVGQQRNYRAAGLIVASLILCTLVGGWSYVWDRFLTPAPFSYRREMLTSTAAMIRARPLTGFGLGAWPSAYPAFAVFDPPGFYMNHAHNDWAEWIADGGLPFAGILAVFVAVFVLRARRSLWSLGIPAVFAHALVDFPLQKPALVFALFFLAGANLSLSSQIQAQVTPSRRFRFL